MTTAQQATAEALKWTDPDTPPLYVDYRHTPRLFTSYETALAFLGKEGRTMVTTKEVPIVLESDGVWEVPEGVVHPPRLTITKRRRSENRVLSTVVEVKWGHLTTLVRYYANGRCILLPSGVYIPAPLRGALPQVAAKVIPEGHCLYQGNSTFLLTPENTLRSVHAPIGGPQ